MVFATGALSIVAGVVQLYSFLFRYCGLDQLGLDWALAAVRFRSVPNLQG
ncbi:hypothetical protein [Natrarchaeobius halalkaliphilus]|nr:hypothetical protein [Natrarchaeobius halalkaliphilus]